MVELQVINRSIKGKQVRRLRTEGLVPANIVIKSQDSIPISVDKKELTKSFRESWLHPTGND